MAAITTKRVTKNSGLTCPACSCRDIECDVVRFNVHRCAACEAIFANTITLGDSYSIVQPSWDDNPNLPVGTERYFDFTCLSSKGIVRRHGWYNPTTGKITQVG